MEAFGQYEGNESDGEEICARSIQVELRGSSDFDGEQG